MLSVAVRGSDRVKGMAMMRGHAAYHVPPLHISGSDRVKGMAMMIRIRVMLKSGS